jgi:acetylornithine deacetylase/succinyl-diaminopimelate desuccinylase-like protein
LLLAHLDVVTARASDWTLPPYRLTEKDGFLYGRGTSDIKDGAAILVAAFIQMQKDGVTPDRDVILALTAGEESGGDYSGVEWLLKNRRDLIDAEWCWNVDGGDPQLLHGKRISRTVQASEKVYATFQLEVTGAGGHSSLPTKENPIYRLAAALSRIAAYDFPVHLSEVTRGALAAAARNEPPAVAADLKQVIGPSPDAAAVKRLAARSPFYNAQMRTTCVATQIEGGHAENALPQRAVAKVNCRILPEEAPGDFVLKTLTRVAADTNVKVTVAYPAVPSPASPLRPEILRPLEAVTAKFWPGVPSVPQMETGATDGAILRNAGIPTYGMSTVFLDVDDVRAHGRDERIIAKEFDAGADYALALLKAFTTRN